MLSRLLTSFQRFSFRMTGPGWDAQSLLSGEKVTPIVASTSHDKT